MKYTGINIGPIVDTLSLARKPKELWAASYMFSYLMERIVKAVKDKGLRIVSPVEAGDNDRSVGLYPDRAYVGNKDNVDISEAISEAVREFEEATGVSEDYVNVMSADVEAASDADAIKKLNDIFARAELANRPVDDEGREKVRDLITKKDVNQVLGGKCNISTIEEIATRAKNEGNYSYWDYICIVQADGDNMGKTIEGSGNKLGELSAALSNQGKEAKDTITGYGGTPIYIGGDDLLFLAPVVSRNGKSNIFDLLKKLNTMFHDKMQEYSNSPISMSFGLSITYHKYPLYEALKAARELLYEAKKEKYKDVEVKNAIAWCLRKHSGSGFSGFISQNEALKEVSDKFYELFGKKSEEKVVSAIAHKLRENMSLVEIIRKSGQENWGQRLEAFYTTMLNEGDASNKAYTKSTRELLGTLFKAYPDDNEKEISEILETMYGMLRTAKFINGEEERDE